MSKNTLNNKKEFDFVGKRKIFFAISIVIFIIGIIFNIVFGLELSIDFKGGTAFKYSYEGEITDEAVEKLLSGITDVNLDIETTTSNVDGSSVLQIYTNEAFSITEQESIEKALRTEFADNNLGKGTISALTPTMGKSFLIKCVVAIILASVALVVYVAFRFRKIGGVSAGVMGLVALAHDITIAYFAFVIFRIPLDENFVAVVLSILGYSLNDTIVIYDRIRENSKKLGKEVPIANIVNTSINQSFSRSFNTGFCTFIAVATIAVLAMIFKLDTIISFAVPMMLGVVSGAYSTICICGPLWVVWQERKEKKTDKSVA